MGPNPQPWMLATQKEVLDSFHNIPGAYSDGSGDTRFVFIDGTRKDKVLLVAHADTVFRNHSIKIGFHNDIFFSKSRNLSYKNKAGETVKYGVGIGADDRAGCAIVWELQKLGHSILITSGEEIGGVGSNFLMRFKYWREKINKEHQFAVQFDRKGANDIVFYDVGTKAFKKYVSKSTGYVPASGSFTDICNLCDDICGVNMSVGYYFEHSCNERLIYSQWLRTLNTAYKWLSQDNLPKFNLKPDITYKKRNTEDVLDTVAKNINNNLIENIKKENIFANRTFLCCRCNKTMSGCDFFKNRAHCCFCDSALCVQKVY